MKEHNRWFPHINMVNYCIRALEPVRMKRKSNNNPGFHTSCLLTQPELTCRPHLCLLKILLFISILKSSPSTSGIWLLPAGILWSIHKEYMENCIVKLTGFISYFWKVRNSDYFKLSRNKFPLWYSEKQGMETSEHLITSQQSSTR